MINNNYIDFILQNSINRYAVKNSQVTDIRNHKTRNGKVAITFSKESLSDFGVNGVIVGSKEKLISNNNATHWTPNPYCFLSYNDKGRVTNHTKDNLKQINTFVIDIDKNYSLNTLQELLISANMRTQLPFPNLYIKTPNGWHLYYTLDNAFYLNREKRSLFVAEKIHKNILRALSNYIDVDLNATPFGFFRYPTEANVMYYNPEYISKNELMEWSIEYSENNKTPLEVVYRGVTTKTPKWVSKLLSLKNIKAQSGYNACRNNTIFTLALFYYSTGTEYDKAFNILDEFNSNLNNSLNTCEFSKIIDSAFSGKYKAPTREHIERILETWTNESYQEKDSYFSVFYKHKKDRADRTRSHYEERVQDIITYLEQNTDVNNLFIEGNIKDILDEFNMPKSTFYDILNTLRDKNIIYKKTIGKGRYSKTRITLFSTLLKKFYKVVLEKKIKREHYIEYLESILNSISKEHDNVDFNDLVIELREYINCLNHHNKITEKQNVIKEVLII